MEFSALYKKIIEMDSGDFPLSPAVTSPVEDTDSEVDEELYQDTEMDECGDAPKDVPPNAGVNMNVGMNGTGPEGIRQLLDILRNLEDAQDDPEIVISRDGPELEAAEAAPIQAITPSGTDLHQSTSAYPATQLGDNPMARQYTEALHHHLADLYEEICSR